MILRELDQLEGGAALRRPLAGTSASKENARSVLNRAPSNTQRNVATATDKTFLHVWNGSKSS